MTPLVKATLILAAAGVLATIISVYFSPYQTCLRHSSEVKNAAIYCTGRPPN